jgi:hypothetical protein
MDNTEKKYCDLIKDDFYNFGVDMDSDHYREQIDSKCLGDCPTYNADSELRVLNYNMYQYYGDGNCFHNFCSNQDRMQIERIEEFLDDHADRFDVMSLQEIWHQNVFNSKIWLIDAAKKRGFHYHYMPKSYTQES